MNQQSQEHEACCPYNSTHVMPQSKLVYHIQKCPTRKQIGNQFITCPYNCMHIMRKELMQDHKETCESRINDESMQELQAAIQRQFGN